MADNNEPDVKIVDRVEVAPAGDGETVEAPDSSQEQEGEEKTEEGAEGASEDGSEPGAEGEEEGEPDSEPEPKIDPEPKAAPKNEQYGDIKRIPGESDREFALRIENARLRGEIRGKQANEILTPPQKKAAAELSPEKKAILAKIKPEDMKAFREVLDVAAEEMGFVRKDQLEATTYQREASQVLDGFLEKHPEYLPKNDPGNVLWDRFKEEYAIYKVPDSPKALARLLEKVHKDVYGIKPAAALKTNEAAKQNVKVASHGGSSRPAPSREGVKRSAGTAAQGLRTDMLKGFSPEEIAEMSGGE